jgi:hypothetical protein
VDVARRGRGEENRRLDTLIPRSIPPALLFQAGCRTTGYAALPKRARQSWMDKCRCVGHSKRHHERCTHPERGVPLTPLPTPMIERDMCGCSILEITDLQCGRCGAGGCRRKLRIRVAVPALQAPDCPLLAMRLAEVCCPESRSEAASTSSCRCGMTETWQLCTTGPRDSWTGDRAERLRIPGAPCHGFETGLVQGQAFDPRRPALGKLGQPPTPSLCVPQFCFHGPIFCFTSHSLHYYFTPVFAQPVCYCFTLLSVHCNISKHFSGAP